MKNAVIRTNTNAILVIKDVWCETYIVQSWSCKQAVST